MKKLLSLLGAFALTGTAAISVVACGDKDESSFTLPAYPNTIEEASTIITNYSKKRAEAYVELYKKYPELMAEKEPSEDIMNNAYDMILKLGAMESLGLVEVVVPILANLNPAKDFKITYYDFNGEIAESEEVSLEFLQSIVSESFNETYDSLNEEIADLSNETVGSKENREKSLENLKSILKWMLDGTKLIESKTLVKEFNLGKLEKDFEEEDTKNVIEVIKKVNTDFNLTEEDIETFYANGTELGVTLKEDKYIGILVFTYTVEENTTPEE